MTSGVHAVFAFLSARSEQTNYRPLSVPPIDLEKSALSQSIAKRIVQSFFIDLADGNSAAERLGRSCRHKDSSCHVCCLKGIVVSHGHLLLIESECRSISALDSSCYPSLSPPHDIVECKA